MFTIPHYGMIYASVPKQENGIKFELLGIEWNGMEWSTRWSSEILNSQSLKKISNMITLPCLLKRIFPTRGDESQMGVSLVLKLARNSKYYN